MLWEEIKTQEDAEKLLNKVGHFHDGCFRELHVWSGSYINDTAHYSALFGLKAKVLIQCSKHHGIGAVELLFTDVQKINMVQIPEGSFPEISHATLKYEDGVFYWADERDWDIKDPNNDEILWIAAKGLKWRDKSEWMGDALRDGAD